MRTLTYVVSSDITTLEPTQVSGWTDHTAALALFGSLTFNFDGATGEVGYHPYLAESVAPVDPRCWEIRVREGLHFHDGAPLDAEALKFSLDRILDPEFPSARWFHDAPIDRVEVVDDRTVHLHTSEPIAILHARLLRADGYVVSPQAYRDAPPWTNVPRTEMQPVGAGPFRFHEHAPGQHLLLDVYEGFHDPRGHARPNFDRLELRVVPDPGAALAMLERGEVDIVPIPYSLASSVDRIAGARCVSGPDTSRLSFEINQDAHEALRDVRVRRAINHAIDVDGLLATHTGGHGVQRTSLVNPPNVHDGITPHSYDPDRARSLLGEAGWLTGLEIDVHWSVSDEIGAVARDLAPFLEAAGIRVRAVEHLDWSEEYLPRQKKGTLGGLHGHGHGGVEMTVETDLWPHHPGRLANSMNWRGPHADRFVQTYTELQSEVDTERQRKLGCTLQEIAHSEAISVVLWQSPRFVAVSDRVKRYRPYPGGHNEDFWTIRLDES